MMKRIFLLLSILLLIFCVSCETEEKKTKTFDPYPDFNTTGERVQLGPETHGGVEYLIYSDGTADLYMPNIDEYEFNFYETLVIPSEISGAKVTNILDGAFEETLFTDIVLPDSLVTIGERAFRKSDIKKIVIPESVREIGKEAFDTCKNLAAAEVKGTVEIKEGTFYNCRALEKVTLGNGVTSIGDDAFGDCRNLKEVILPDTLTSIGSFAFYSCRGAKITVPKSVKTIGEECFKDTDFLESQSAEFVIVGDGVLIKCSLDAELIKVPRDVKYIAAKFTDKLKELIVPHGTKFCENAVSSSVKITEE